jgi:gliding motility-associated-like protein
VIIVIPEIQDKVYAPNVFSPNNDGANDHWTIVSRMENTYVEELALFDRWGNTVFYKKEFLLNSFEGWDGKLNDEAMDPGVFIFMAKLTLGDGEKVTMRGDVTLLK